MFATWLLSLIIVLSVSQTSWARECFPPEQTCPDKWFEYKDGEEHKCFRVIPHQIVDFVTQIPFSYSTALYYCQDIEQADVAEAGESGLAEVLCDGKRKDCQKIICDMNEAACEGKPYPPEEKPLTSIYWVKKSNQPECKAVELDGCDPPGPGLKKAEGRDCNDHKDIGVICVKKL